MAESRQVISADGRARVAYEMARDMWIASKQSMPKLEDEGEFLKLVANCTHALVYRDG